MSNAERKARKRAGIKHRHLEKVPTGSLNRKEKPLTLDQQLTLTQYAMEMGRSFWQQSSAAAAAHAFPTAIQAAAEKESA